MKVTVFNNLYTHFRYHIKYSILLLSLFITNLHAFVIYEDTRIWNKESITFYFLDGTPTQKNEVKRFAKLWERYTGIKFNYLSSSPGFFNFSPYYTITFKGNSNQSSIGRVNGQITFGDLSDDIIYRQSTILHEFGHMLGLSHEHQRLDRIALLNSKKMLKNCKTYQLKTKKWCNQNILKKNSKEIFINSEYDIDSIMHYGMYTLTGGDPKYKKTNGLTYTDKYFIAMLYNQNISDKTLKKMHEQDVWKQKKFERDVHKNEKTKIMKLSTASCKILAYPNKSKDGKYCQTGFMIIGSDGYSLANSDLKGCYHGLSQISDKIQNNPLCKFSKNQLTQKRRAWNNEFRKHGNCKRLEQGQKNSQDLFCTKGFSYVTKNNNIIGDQTICYGNVESAYNAMKDDDVCNLSKNEFNKYQRDQTLQLNRKSKTRYCQVVKKKYRTTTCPKDFDYTIIDKENPNTPINSKCFTSTYQAINAMNQISFCQN